MSDPDAPTPDSVTEMTDSAAADLPVTQTQTQTQPQPAPPATPAKQGGLDLSSLKIMPDWVANFSAGAASYAEPREERPDRAGDGRRRFDRDRDRDRGRGPRPAGDRPPRGDKPGFRRDDQRGGQDRGPRRHDQGRGGDPRRDRRDQRHEPRRDWVELPKDLHVSVHPEDKSLDALAAHVRSTGHAFSLFDIARAVLSGGERFGVRFLCDTTRPQPLYRVSADGSLFLTREEATHHVLSSAALEAWYRVEEIELEEPKGNFPSVAVCGMSGEILGPASHHSFQTAVIRLHRERFAHLPIEDYKRRIRTESDPDLVQKWKDQQRKSQQWIPLTGEEGAEPAPLTTRHEMEAHFRRLHADQAVEEIRDVTVPGNIDKKQLSPALFIMLRQAVDSARKHLFEMSQKLSAGFDRRGLKTFKRRSGKMFVCRVRPRAVDSNTLYAGRVNAIVEALKNAPGGLQVAALVKSLAPDIEAPKASPYQETAAATTLNEDQVAVLKDLRWLANEGYIIEYSDGLVTLGVQGEHPPAAKPEDAKENTDPPAAPEPEAAPAETTAAEESPVDEAPPVAPAAETPAPPADDTPAAAAPEIGEDSVKESLPDTPFPVQE